MDLKTVALFLGYCGCAGLAYWSVWLTVVGFGIVTAAAFLWRRQ